MDVLVQDIRRAFRQLRIAKGFTASAALMLALGIGASTAVFAVLDAVVLRPLPFAEPDRLMAFRSIDRRGVPHPTNLSYPNFFGFREQNRVFEHLVSYRDARFTLTDSLPAIQVSGRNRILGSVSDARRAAAVRSRLPSGRGKAWNARGRAQRHIVAEPLR